MCMFAYRIPTYCKFRLAQRIAGRSLILSHTVFTPQDSLCLVVGHSRRRSVVTFLWHGSRVDYAHLTRSGVPGTGEQVHRCTLSLHLSTATCLLVCDWFRAASSVKTCRWTRVSRGNYEIDRRSICFPQFSVTLSSEEKFASFFAKFRESWCYRRRESHG